MILDASYTLLVACIALLIGMFVVKFTPFLQKNHIPEAVVGGFIVAIVLLIIDKTSGYSFTFDASLQSLLMLTFFSSIGLSSDFSRLIKGGKPLVLLTIAVTILIAIQNTVGMSMAVMMNESPFIGLIAGSITLTGGHGRGLTLSGTKTHVKQRFLPLTPLLMVLKQALLLPVFFYRRWLYEKT
ncbi:sodium/glutamate symporter [Escherichia coli]|nr:MULTISPECIES: sodium/glutamate symporter [Gammaproteobacteria]GEI12936.1 glutamate permease [Escherichia coli O145:H28]SQS50072.1 putative glutamate permease [Escherichia coli]